MVFQFAVKSFGKHIRACLQMQGWRFCCELNDAILCSFPCSQILTTTYKHETYGIFVHTFDYAFLVTKRFNVKGMEVLYCTSMIQSWLRRFHQIFCEVQYLHGLLIHTRWGGSFLHAYIFWLFRNTIQWTTLKFSVKWRLLVGCWNNAAVTDFFNSCPKFALKLLRCTFWTGSSNGNFCLSLPDFSNDSAVIKVGRLHLRKFPCKTLKNSFSLLFTLEFF